MGRSSLSGFVRGFLCVVLCFAGSGQFLLAYTPESPTVRAVADRARVFLAGRETPHPQLGGNCLRGLACYKYERRYGGAGVATEIPEVQQAVAAIRAYLKDGVATREESINYSLGLAIIFLCEIDENPKRYETETKQLLQHLYDNQRADGAWSYHNYKTGDTSQTQYGILATWYATKSGYSVPQRSLQRSVDWLIRTQDPSGAAPYQGIDPGNYNRVAQSDLRLSMSPAALGCFYITEELAGLSEAAKTPRSAFRPAAPQPKINAGAKADMVNEPMLRRAINDGNRYYRANFQLDIGRNFHYYLYSLERYESIKAHSEDRLDAPAPWYDAGVEHLATTQLSDGSWNGTRGGDISASFALLFLARSMQVALEDTASGTAVGGYDLPDDLTRVTAKDIRDLQRPELHRPKISIGFDKLIEMIQQGDWSELDLAHVDIEPFNRTENGEQHEKQMATMRSLLANGKFSDRFAVTKILAFSGDVEQVPHLIFALTDGDHRITRAARDGLRLISRKFTGFELSDTPSQQEKARAAKRWNAWYRSVRPEL